MPDRRVIQRGTCAVCGYRVPLRLDGTIQTHHLYSGNERNAQPCRGSGKPPRFAEENRLAKDAAKPFSPDWCLAPAATLREWMSDNGLSVPVLSVNGLTGVVTKDGAALLIGQVLNREPLTEAHARTLERCTSIPARFWLALEHNYRAGLAAGLTDVTGDDDA